MKYKAIVSFSGAISMASGDVCEIADTSLATDLLKAHYIIPLGDDAVKEKPKKATKRKAKKSDDN